MNRKEKNVRIKTYGVKGLMEWRGSSPRAIA